jgi:hypothetical protein
MDKVIQLQLEVEEQLQHLVQVLHLLQETINGSPSSFSVQSHPLLVVELVDH